jgi:hypothetical protein
MRRMVSARTSLRSGHNSQAIPSTRNPGRLQPGCSRRSAFATHRVECARLGRDVDPSAVILRKARPGNRLDGPLRRTLSTAADGLRSGRSAGRRRDRGVVSHESSSHAQRCRTERTNLARHRRPSSCAAWADSSQVERGLITCKRATASTARASHQLKLFMLTAIACGSFDGLVELLDSHRALGKPGNHFELSAQCLYNPLQR